jgi:hypothetical protein
MERKLVSHKAMLDGHPQKVSDDDVPTPVFVFQEKSADMKFIAPLAVKKL